MVIKKKYSKYNHRILKGLFKYTLIPFICMILVFFYSDLDKHTTIFSGCLFGAMCMASAFSVFKANKNYLTEIRFVNDCCEFEIAFFNKRKETIKTEIVNTKIEMRKIIAPLTNFRRNYKLVIETKNASTYETIIQQYEVDEWTTDEFQDLLKIYRDNKFNTISKIK